MQRPIEQALAQIELSIRNLQALITELRPAALDQIGLAPALEALLKRVAPRSGIEIDADIRLAFEQGGRSAPRSGRRGNALPPGPGVAHQRGEARRRADHRELSRSRRTTVGDALRLATTAAASTRPSQRRVRAGRHARARRARRGQPVGRVDPRRGYHRPRRGAGRHRERADGQLHRRQSSWPASAVDARERSGPSSVESDHRPAASRSGSPPPPPPPARPAPARARRGAGPGRARASGRRSCSAATRAAWADAAGGWSAPPLTSARMNCGSPPVSSSPRSTGRKARGSIGAPSRAAIASATASACCVATPPCLIGQVVASPAA